MNPIQGSVMYDFREAVTALARSSEDAAVLAARWLDLCDTEAPKDVKVTLSSGETKTVPNLAKVIQSLTQRVGAIKALSLTAGRPGQGTVVSPSGVEVGTGSAAFADGTQRSQCSYQSPYNMYYDAGYMGPTASDRFSFFEIPRFTFFNIYSGVGPDGATHTIELVAPKADDYFMQGRLEPTVCLAAEFTLVNGDPNRSVTVRLVCGPGAGALAAVRTLAPGTTCSFVVWAFKGGDLLALAEV